MFPFPVMSPTTKPKGFGAHRYWAEWFSNYNGRDFVTVCEMEMRETAGGSNFLTGGTASASSYLSGNSSLYAASKTVDGNTSTRWASSSSGAVDSGAIWAYDLGSGVSKQCVQTTITADAGIFYGNQEAPKSGWIGYSDDASTYNLAFGYTGQTSWSTNEQRVFSDPALDGTAQHRYWAIASIANGGTSVLRLAEIEMRATSGGADQCSGGTPIGEGWTNIANAFDNSSANYAEKNGGIGWIGYDFGSAVNVTEIMLNTDAGTSLTAPTRFGVVCSDNGVHWSCAWMVTSDRLVERSKPSVHEALKIKEAGATKRQLAPVRGSIDGRRGDFSGPGCCYRATSICRSPMCRQAPPWQ